MQIKNHFSASLLAVFLALVWVGLSYVHASSMETLAPGVEQIRYQGWEHSIRLYNAEAEVVIVPSIGRIMSYRFLDGENVLWVNLSSLGRTGDSMEWLNWGGDKIWPWPEKSWRRGRFKPPVDWDAKPHRIEIIGPRAVRMTSPPWAEHGLRVIREVSLSSSGTLVTVRNWLVQNASTAPSEIGLWSITQVPRGETMLVRVDDGAGEKFRNMGRTEWKTVEKVGADVLCIGWPVKISKAGFESSCIAVARGITLFTQTLTGSSTIDEKWEPCTKAQIFCKTAPAYPGDFAPYAELEFTSPTQSGNGKLSVTWELVRLVREGLSPQEVATFFQNPKHR